MLRMTRYFVVGSLTPNKHKQQFYLQVKPVKSILLSMDIQTFSVVGTVQNGMDSLIDKYA